MAALTATDLVGKTPRGRYFQVTLSFTVANTGAADEWIATGLDTIISVDGFAVQGATKGSTNFVLNAQGTGQTAGTSGGDLGVESDVAATIHVTVTGR